MRPVYGQRWGDLPRCGVEFPNKNVESDHKIHHCKRPLGHIRKSAVRAAKDYHTCACGVTAEVK